MWKHCSSPPLLLIYAYGQPNPTHLLSFSSPSPSIFAMGRCCSLSTDLPVETLGPHAPITTVLPYTYSTPYPMLAFYIQYIYYCHHQPCFSVPTLITPVTVTLWAQCIPTNLCLYVSCIYHMMFVYILCTCCAQHLLFPSPFCHTTFPPSPSYLLLADLKRISPPPLMFRGSA